MQKKTRGQYGSLNNKLASDSGVSILLVLVLLLVCVAVSGIIFSASTAAAGRASKVADVDARYYSVLSAAELFRDELEGNTSATILRTKETTTKKTYSITVRPLYSEEEYSRVRTLVSSTDTDSYYSSIDGKTVARDYSLIEDCAIDLLFGFGAVPANDSDMYSSTMGSSFTSDKSRYFVLSTSTGEDTLEVSVKMTIKPNGSIEFEFSSPTSAENSKVFKMKIAYTAHITETTKNEKTPETRISLTGNDTVGYTEVISSSVKNTKEFKIEWTYKGLTIVGEGE